MPVRSAPLAVGVMGSGVGGTWKEVASVPSDELWLVKSIAIADDSGEGDYIALAVRPGGGANRRYYRRLELIAAYGTYAVEGAFLCLNPTDEMDVFATKDETTYVISGAKLVLEP